MFIPVLSAQGEKLPKLKLHRYIEKKPSVSKKLVRRREQNMCDIRLEGLTARR